jgi:TolB-like protein/Flp pilus assembly protein TadD
VEALSSTEAFLFEGFQLDRRGLFRADKNAALVPVDIGSRALDVLGVLLRRPDELLSRSEIMAAAWPGMVVEANNLNVQISALRRAIDRDRANGSCIQTVARRGYRFVAPVTRPSLQTEPRPKPRLSIVVLPFTDLSDDREQQYFADGITQDLTTDLSRLDGMFVISRNTALSYRNKPFDTRRIGHELGVRYVLDGSVQRAGKQMRVTAQLIDAATDGHLWAERFDRETGDLFALQNEITGRIANALGVELIALEAARPTDSRDAPDYILRGRAAWLKPPSRNTHAERIAMFENALVLDPRSAEAQSWLAGALAHRVLDAFTASDAADVERAQELVHRALAASPGSPTAHMANGDVLRAQGRYVEAIPEYETVLAINRNAIGALDALANCKQMTGSLEDAITLAQQAIRLSPRDPRIGHLHIRIGQAHLLQSRSGEAIRWLQRARRALPELPFVHLLLASAHGLTGDIDRAAAELGEARLLHGGDRYSSIDHVRAFSGGYRGATPDIRALFDTTYLVGLRKAGMPEE